MKRILMLAGLVLAAMLAFDLEPDAANGYPAAGSAADECAQFAPAVGLELIPHAVLERFPGRVEGLAEASAGPSSGISWKVFGPTGVVLVYVKAGKAGTGYYYTSPSFVGVADHPHENVSRITFCKRA
jgi:hypothetical protein